MMTRTSLVTGGTRGIGRAVALRLARTGDRVLVVGRDPDAGASVLAELQRIGRGRDHRFLSADLSLLGDTARLAAQVTTLVDRLDAAVLCAGEFALSPAWTEEGLERTVALNFLSRYALVADLLPVLKAADHGRVVLVAAAGQYADTLDLRTLAPGRAHPGRRLAGASQFANDLYAVELADRLATTRVGVTCVYPGLTRTDVFRSARGVPFVVRALAMGLQRVLGRSPDAAADTPAYLAQDPAAIGVTRRFFGPGRHEIPVPPRVEDPARREDLWRAAATVVGHVTSRVAEAT